MVLQKCRSLNMRVFFVVLAGIFLFSSCQYKKGDFAFHVSDQEDWSEIQKSLYRPKEFKKLRLPISFGKDKNIWFVYRPALPRWKKTYAISLSQKTLGYNEIELRNQVLKRSNQVLLDNFENLEEGKYLLRIAYNNKVIDSIEFEVRPPEQNKEIDYEAPLIEEDSFAQKQKDDILFFSK